MRIAEHRSAGELAKSRRDAGAPVTGRRDAGAPVTGRRDAGASAERTAGLRPAAAAAQVVRSRGYLPHVDAPNLVQHIVFRLADSLPEHVRQEVDRAPRHLQIRAIDAALDRGHGQRHLAIPAIAEVVQTALFSFNDLRYRLIAWCVMPNHVHVVIQVAPEDRLAAIVQSWKSYTAKQANRLLGRTGRFWAREYFDRFIRDEGHLARTVTYVEGNPIKAGLSINIEDWRFSSAWGGWAEH